MYLYYLLTLYKVDVRFIKPYLTYLQIMQFISAYLSLYLWFPIETSVNKAVMIVFLIYNAGLIVLFSKFVKDTYYPRNNPIKNA
jgi:hypothetical protein